MNEAEFEQVYWRLRPGLLGAARSQLDEDAAHDVVSATFETLWRKNLTFPGNNDTPEQEQNADLGPAWQSLRAFAFAVLKGHVSNEYRSRKRRAHLGEQLMTETVRRSRTDHAAHGAGPSDEALDVHHWLDGLAESDRNMIGLFNAGFSTHEIAVILGCSATAAARRRDRAKKRLRAIIERDRAASASAVDSATTNTKSRTGGDLDGSTI